MAWTDWVPFALGGLGIVAMAIALVMRERRTRLQDGDEVPHHDEDPRVMYDSAVARERATQPYTGGTGGANAGGTV